MGGAGEMVGGGAAGFGGRVAERESGGDGTLSREGRIAGGGAKGAEGGGGGEDDRGCRGVG